MPGGRKKSLYAIYRGGDIIAVGTDEECATFMGWKNKQQVIFYSSPSHHQRLNRRADKGNRVEVFRVGKVESEMEAVVEQEVEQVASERGKLLNMFGVTGDDGLEHKVGFVFSRGRKHADLLAVLQQEKESGKARLSGYGQSLFDSCFRNW